MRNNTDIIIPLFNGYSFFKECFESILKNTKPGTYRLIIVDDQSSEEKLLEYLKKITEEYPNVVFLRNEINIGFIGSVNRGMKYDLENDVLLLNSDTVVTKNWLEKIRRCAYSRPEIATVTPITNNGALVSFPNQWKDNEIPKGYTLDSIADLIEKVSLKIYPEIPSPVGFCMFIKREALEKAGFFDEVYGKGYGEENDFGMKAYRLGYRHAVDDATFVLHLGSMTFKNIGEEKKKLIEKNTAILHGRYPELNTLLTEFEEKKPLKPVYDNIRINMETDFIRKPGILFVAVNEPEFHATGALLHIQNLIKNTSFAFSKYLIYRNDKRLILVYYPSVGEKIRYEFNFHESFGMTKYSHAEIEFFWELILKKFNIDIIHFQTPQELPLSLFSISKKLGKTVFFTIHDFLLYCPSFILVKYESNESRSRFCNYERNEDVCRECLFTKMKASYIPTNFQKHRRSYIKKNVIPYIDKFFFPSKFIKREISKLFPELIREEKTAVIAHGLDMGKISTFNKTKQNKFINVAFLGSFTKEKGSEIFKAVIKKLSSNKLLNFFVVGSISKSESYKLRQNNKNVKIIGSYEITGLNDILKKNEIDVIVLPSICPETFSLTMSESWNNGIPVIVLNLGAQEERVLETGAGWIVNEEYPEKEITEILYQITQDGNALAEKRNKIPELKSGYKNAKEYEIFYKQELSKRDRDNRSASNLKELYGFLQPVVSLSPEIEQEKEREISRKLFSLEKSRIKHYIFVVCDKLGLVEKVRPFYYRHKKKIEKIISYFACCFC